jgi:hypothetical protein
MGGGDGIRRVLVALLAGVAMLVWVAAAEAAFPGQNGRIAFVAAGSIYTVNSDGADRLTVSSSSTRAMVTSTEATTTA